jgi:hypothetical protein
MPEACMYVPNLESDCLSDDGMCSVESDALPGTYTIEVEVFDGADCWEPPCTPCAADDTGTCATYEDEGAVEWFTTGDPRRVAASVDYPSAGGMAISIPGA